MIRHRLSIGGAIWGLEGATADRRADSVAHSVLHVLRSHPALCLKMRLARTHLRRQRRHFQRLAPGHWYPPTSRPNRRLIVGICHFPVVFYILRWRFCLCSFGAVALGRFIRDEISDSFECSSAPFTSESIAAASSIPSVPKEPARSAHRHPGRLPMGYRFPSSLPILRCYRSPRRWSPVLHHQRQTHRLMGHPRLSVWHLGVNQTTQHDDHQRSVRWADPRLRLTVRLVRHTERRKPSPLSFLYRMLGKQSSATP